MGGLNPADRSTIQNLRINCVVHSAAAVDHARPYDSLRPSNVAAVTALVDLVSPRLRDRAYYSQPPRFVCVSTMSVIPIAEAGWAGCAESLVPPACAASLESGYAQSKLVME